MDGCLLYQKRRMPENHHRSPNHLCPEPTSEIAEPSELLPSAEAQSFRDFPRAVVDEEPLPARTKQLVAIALAHVTRCADCIRSRTETALANGVTREAIAEAARLAEEIAAGGACAHAVTRDPSSVHLSSAPKQDPDVSSQRLSVVQQSITDRLLTRSAPPVPPFW